MKAVVVFFALLFAAQIGSAEAQTKKSEERRKEELVQKLSKEFGQEKITAIFSDPRLALYRPKKPKPQPQPTPTPKPEGNPFLADRFGLLTDESLDRCRDFYIENKAAMDATSKKYPVPKEYRCGILRMETNFGIPTASSPHPIGSRPVINSLASLYVFHPQRRKFAFGHLICFIKNMDEADWDLFDVVGSPTGAYGLPQFEPCSVRSYAADGNGDGEIDLFDPADADASIARYLILHGWDDNPKHQLNAIASYYGLADTKKYYAKAVLKYAEAMKGYLEEHPIEEKLEKSATP